MWTLYAAAAAILANIFWFGRSAFTTPFAPDDMMNLAGYWEAGWRAALKANLLVFTSSYRPLGALFYLPLYTAFGLNPLPYHVVAFVFMVANTWLVFRLGRLLTDSVPAALVTAFLVSYQAGMGNLYYDTAVVYDILCAFFYLLALGWYVAIRHRGDLPTWRQTAGLAALYACALNSKEMAVSWPLVVLGYEVLYRGFSWRAARTALLAGAMTVAFIAAKTLGPESLAAEPAYRPVFTWEQFARSTARHLDLFTQQRLHFFGTGGFLLVWAILLVAALARKRPDLRFCAWMILVTPLPVVFIDRALACIYIPYVAWALFAAILVTAPAARQRWALAAALTAALIGWQVRRNVRMKGPLDSTIAAHGRQTQAAIRQLQALHPVIEPHSQVIFLNDPFTDYDMIFIAALWRGDRTIGYHLQRRDPRTPEELAAMDYIFRFEPGGRLVQLKP